MEVLFCSREKIFYLLYEKTSFIIFYPVNAVKGKM